MTVFEWIRQAPAPLVCTSETFIYDDMESQSGRALPLIYRPFDIADRAHWRDRGALFDFLLATGGPDRLAFANVTIEGLGRSRTHLVDARVCTTVHPSGANWVQWLREAGFRLVHPTCSGAAMVGDFFDAYPRNLHPQTLEDLDRLAQPIAALAVQTPAPIEEDPIITAIK